MFVNTDRKQKLIDLDAESLAAALLELAAQSDVADDLVESLIATPTENIQRFRKKLTGLKRSRRFIDWRESSGFARKLEMLLRDLRAGVTDPLVGAELFEQTRIASWGKLSTGALVDIARVYLESGNVQTAYSWLNKIPENETFHSHERDQLLQEIYRRLGDDEKLAELLYRNFRSYHSSKTLQDLLAVIGSDRRDEVISKEVVLILANPIFCTLDAEFMISVGKIDEAERFILDRAEQLDGDYYGGLISLAKTMESENRNLAAALIYRSLLISVLERGYTKAYPHGVRYLKKLDNLATSITQWMKFDKHEMFKDQIYLSHGRKYSFWSKYEL